VLGRMKKNRDRWWGIRRYLSCPKTHGPFFFFFVMWFPPIDLAKKMSERAQDNIKEQHQCTPAGSSAHALLTGLHSSEERKTSLSSPIRAAYLPQAFLAASRLCVLHTICGGRIFDYAFLSA